MSDVKQGDTILIIAGDDRGRTGKVIKVSPSARIQVEGINIQKKHHRPKKEGEKGQVIEKPGFISISNVKIICPKCGKPAKIGHTQAGDKRKKRVCKKCQAVI
ncbi:50S ribosomal protein L24 [Patescibacteria group bacterium]|nr:50S ribosomal protein L24 [Patescibacteria group bacterium]MBU4162456.1 50S ribosomal protein L24 [Patescibacteria group bacterium]